MELIDIDIEIAERLFGWEWKSLPNGCRLLLPPQDDPRHNWAYNFNFKKKRTVASSLRRFTRDRNLLAELMKKLSVETDGGDWSFTFGSSPKGYRCTLTGKEGKFSAEAETVPLSACLAVLEAVGGPKIESEDIADNDGTENA